MIRTHLIGLLLLLITFRSNAQDVRSKLDSFYTSLAKEDRLNGNVLIAEGEQVVYQKSFGFADFEERKVNNMRTAFQLASLSKPFTAIAILQLADQRKLNLDDKLKKYIPTFPYPGITISQLLSHSSGVSDQDLGPALATFEKANGHPHTNTELLQFLAGHPVSFKLAPGQKWWYSNLGYELLACLVEKVSGKSFDRYLARYIFKPAGMKNTYLLSSPKAQQMYQAKNYDYPKIYATDRIRIDQTAADYKERAYGHSNIVSTCEDLMKLANHYFNGSLVKLETVSKAIKGTRLENGQPNSVWMNIGGLGNTVDGLGWFIFTGSENRGQLFHAGGMAGAVTILLYDMEKKQTVIILDNTGSEGIYKNAQNGIRILNHQQMTPAKRNLAKLYGRWLVSKGEKIATEMLTSNKQDTANFTLSENDMNNLGYAFLGDKLYNNAIAVFKLNCTMFPISDNAWNSYGEALEQIGQTKEAEEMYVKSLHLNPVNIDSQKALERIHAASGIKK